MGDDDREGTLRCGVCFRNLMTEYGRRLHDVYWDGSMRCFAEEAQDTEHGYTSTRVVLESAARRLMVREFVIDHGNGRVAPALTSERAVRP